MLLGEGIKKVTSALGIAPCKSCQERAEMLNQLSRRGVLKSLAIAPFLVKNTILKLVWQAAGKTPPLSVAAVLGFLRSLNNAQILLHFKNGQFGAVEDVLGAVASHREHYKPGTGPYEWMSRFNPFSDEVLPGHFLDYALITAGYPRVLSDERKVQNGYRVVLRGEHYTFITDEETVIYMTVTPEQAPPASSLPSAREFPGATPFGTFRPAGGTQVKPGSGRRVPDPLLFVRVRV